MSLAAALTYTLALLSFTLFLQGIENFLCTRQASFFKIWSYRNLQKDLERGLPLPNSWIAVLFSDRAFVFLTLAQIAAAAASYFFPLGPLFALLFLIQLLVCIRFRGTFNGGSDMMAFVVLTGVLISFVGPEEKFQKWGLLYIAIHTLYSYTKSGFVKLVQRDWRQGQALPAFLDRSLFPEVRLLANWLQFQSYAVKILCWLIIVFELAAALLLFYPRYLPLYFGAILLFHLGNVVAFGLNRFFWIWLCSWPAVFFVVSHLNAGRL